jgi:serine/threonine protein kinase
MALAVGTRLGAYEVIGSLGAGGMGEVYRARDTKLNREVALKILPEAFATDPERFARFVCEAQTPRCRQPSPYRRRLATSPVDRDQKNSSTGTTC